MMLPQQTTMVSSSSTSNNKSNKSNSNSMGMKTLKAGMGTGMHSSVGVGVGVGVGSTGSAGGAMPLICVPQLHKKRFHREKKNMKLRMRRSLSAPLHNVQQHLVMPDHKHEAPLSPDRWSSTSSSSGGRSTGTGTGRDSATGGTGAINSCNRKSKLSSRPGFQESDHKKRDSKFKLPTRQTSFQQEEEQQQQQHHQKPQTVVTQPTTGAGTGTGTSTRHSIFMSNLNLNANRNSRQAAVRRTKSNVETVGKIIDQVLWELEAAQSPNQ
ncbi:expressed unknown protein [Seminavis robusta]|uniref:Uncharacterized protein n=1 Tax=Seminavis robusta TaxID=568900 RepID=A0A9N8H9W8_9STRA|nr:expressed unknown protein [Seminavis robusta]|eukprot:Sro270_g104201.1  (268) ;mRNA; r:22828-23631